AHAGAGSVTRSCVSAAGTARTAMSATWTSVIGTVTPTASTASVAASVSTLARSAIARYRVEPGTGCNARTVLAGKEQPMVGWWHRWRVAILSTFGLAVVIAQAIVT